MSFGRLALIVAATCLLSGCLKGQVRSYDPLFTSKDAAQIRFRGGVWADPEPGCRFDAAASMKTWPSCANGEYAKGDEYNRRIAVRGFTIETLLASGEPLILQTHFIIAKEKLRPEYEYSAVRPTKQDGAGRVVAYEMWSVLCHPNEELPASELQKDGRAADDAPRVPTIIPAPPLPPGIVKTDEGCIAQDAAAVRNAAVMTRSLEWIPPRRIFWVRSFKLRDLFGKSPDDSPAAPAP